MNKVVILSNGEAKQMEIEDTLEALQKIVGGYIEIPLLSKELFHNNIDVIINEEGKFIEGMKPEIAVIDKGTHSVLDIVYGNCIFASHDDEGNTTGLSKEQSEFVLDKLRTEVLLTHKDSGEEMMLKALFV